MKYLLVGEELDLDVALDGRVDRKFVLVVFRVYVSRIRSEDLLQRININNSIVIR